MIHVKRNIERPDPAIVREIARYSTATLHEAQGRLGAVSPRIKPVDRDMQLCGPAFTVQCAPRDNIMLQLAINYAQRGDVIVAAAGDYEDAGFFGDVLANACLAKGIAGLVIDSGIRDSREIRALGFPVFSLAICIVGTVKETLGPINRPVVVGGQPIRPGDIIRGDADGVVVVRMEDAAALPAKAAAREAAEAGYIEMYKAGKSVVEVSRLEAMLKAKGLVVEE